MNCRRFHRVAMLLAGLLVVPSWAEGPAQPSEAQRVYQQERARCLLGESNQPRDTCLKEAAAAYAEARRGTLESAPASELARNATLRCQVHPPAERDDCIRRIEGPGHVEGSVGGGGLLRRSETTEFR